MFAITNIMASKTFDSFQQAAAKSSADTEMQRKLRWNIGKYADSVVKGKQQYSDLELASQRAKNIKWKAIENLDKLLLEFESNFTRRGGKVFWAETADEALAEIGRIMKQVKAKSVVKSKSMTTEELHLNQYL